MNRVIIETIIVIRVVLIYDQLYKKLSFTLGLMITKEQ